MPVPFCAVTLWQYWDRIESEYSCWLNVGENFSVATFLPLFSFIMIGVIVFESVGIEVRKLHEVSFMDMDLRINAALVLLLISR